MLELLNDLSVHVSLEPPTKKRRGRSSRESTAEIKWNRLCGMLETGEYAQLMDLPKDQSMRDYTRKLGALLVKQFPAATFLDGN